MLEFFQYQIQQQLLLYYRRCDSLFVLQSLTKCILFSNIKILNKFCYSSTSSTASLSGNSPKTGTSEWAVPQPSRLKYRQKFNSLDKSMSGYLSGEWHTELKNVRELKFFMWAFAYFVAHLKFKHQKNLTGIG